MEEEEEQEPSVVFDSDTLINPNAVMIELLNTDIAYSTMLGSSRLVNIACFTE
jgi:hypothetical protein